MADGRELSPEQVKKLISFLNEKNKGGKCPVCGSAHLRTAPHLVSPIVVAPVVGGGVHLGGINYPMAMVVCDDCLHVMFHAAVPMDLLEPAGTRLAKSSDTTNG